MEICECNNPPDKHPSLHFAQKRDALMAEVGKFMEERYPDFIFGDSFNRKQVELIAFVLREEVP